jgi:DNA mismatch repair protein MutS
LKQNIPKAVIKRAQEILADLERSGSILRNDAENLRGKYVEKRSDESKCELNESVKNILNEIKTTNVDTLTPIEALNVLYKLSNMTNKTFSNCA